MIAATTQPTRPIALEDRLADANGRRRARTLEISKLEDAIARVADLPVGSFEAVIPDDVVEASSYKYRSSATVGLVVRVPHGVAVDVAVTDGYKSTPGRAWRELQPWGIGKSETLERKATAWATTPARLKYSLKKARQYKGN